MFRKITALWLLFSVLVGIAAIAEGESSACVQISFDYHRMSTIASNQFAIWVEDDAGNLVKTLYVTDFAGARRGYEKRDMSLSRWVKAADPARMTDDELDAVSGATPQQGTLTYTWDLTDDSSNPVTDGVYHIFVEGSLYWESSILFSAEIDLNHPESGALSVTEERNQPEQAENADMISNMEVIMMAQENNTANWLGGLEPQEALAYMKEHYDEGLVIVEVNTDYWKLETGFIGAMHIPHDQMAGRYNEIPSGVPVIMHCGAGVVSVPAYETLIEKRPDIPQLSYIAGHPPVQEFNSWLENHSAEYKTGRSRK